MKIPAFTLPSFAASGEASRNTPNSHVPPRLPARFLRRAARAFTLVECALALAVVGIAFVPIMGLLPVGLNTSREAINFSIGSNIAQQLFNAAQQTDFNILTGSSSTVGAVRYFDYQGVEVKDAGSPSITYHAKTRVVATTAYPGAAGSNPSVATVTIQVALNATNQPLLTDSGTQLWSRTNRQPVLTFSYYVSRTQ